MSEPSKLLSALIGAISAKNMPGIRETDGRENAVNVHAREAVRAFRVALDSLGEIVHVAAPIDLITEARLAVQLVNLSAKLEVLLAKIKQFSLEAVDSQVEVKDGFKKLRVMQLLRDIVDLFEAGNQGVHVVKHTRASCAVELLKLRQPWPMTISPGMAGKRDELRDLAIIMLETDLGLVRIPQQEPREPDKNSPADGGTP